MQAYLDNRTGDPDLLSVRLISKRFLGTQIQTTTHSSPCPDAIATYVSVLRRYWMIGICDSMRKKSREIWTRDEV